MANYPQLDNARGVWNMKEVYDAVMGGYWPVAGARGIFAAGNSPSDLNTIDFISMGSTGDASDFGDLTSGKSNMGSAGSFNRSLFCGGPSLNVIEYVETDTAGNAADFGDAHAQIQGSHGTGTATRSIFGGGYVQPAVVNVMQYVNPSSTSNAVDFGDLTVARQDPAAVSSPTRAVFVAGEGSPANVNTIDFVEIATTGAPVVAISTKSMVLTLAGLPSPATKTARVGELTAAGSCRATVKSPKSTAFDVEDGLTYCITLTTAGCT